MKIKSFFFRAASMLRGFWGVAPQFFKYQIVTKLLLTLLILPLFSLATSLLMASRGVAAVSNSDLFQFLLSPQGIAFGLLGLLLIFLVLLLEVFGFITISARAFYGLPEASYRELVRYNLRFFKKLKDPHCILLLLYVAVLAPLTGILPTLSFLNAVRIPNFISSVIFDNPLYLSLTALAFAVMIYFSIRWIYVFHFMVLGDEAPGKALKNSGKTMRASFGFFLVRFGLTTLVIFLGAALVTFLWAFFLAFLAQMLNLSSSGGRVMMFVLLFLQTIVITLATFMYVPLEIYLLTRVFYSAVAKNTDNRTLLQKPPQLQGKTKPSLLDRVLSRKKTLVTLGIAVILAMAIPMGIFFNELIETPRDIAVVGHRGGAGIGAPENCLPAVDVALKNGAAYVEVDVQRTLDGAYILNHDKNFARVANDPRTAQEMTLKQIKELNVGRGRKGAFLNAKVPTAEELMDHCKGHIGIYLELKGVSADRKMADDMVRLIRAHNMQKEVVVMSLDYELISYVAKTYPDITTGFVYFLAFGRIDEFVTDVLILEEDAATEANLDRIHAAGKKAVVWTVNTPESMEKFSGLEVDGIITDDTEGMQQVLKARENRSEQEILFSEFFAK
ncbi:Glycerophosphoryl diester phosphodiesterase [Clostridiaceae bacterium JG1575]|nr:Glycerophosphoryl diester phosphodiesterase [Clostridiaceae bacterium JG1575]